MLYVLDFLGGSSGARTQGRLIKSQPPPNNISDLIPKHVYKIEFSKDLWTSFFTHNTL